MKLNQIFKTYCLKEPHLLGGTRWSDWLALTNKHKQKHNIKNKVTNKNTFSSQNEYLTHRIQQPIVKKIGKKVKKISKQDLDF